MVWMTNHRVVAAILMAAYLAFVVLAHDVMQRPAHWAQNRLGGASWNTLVMAVSIPLAAIFVLWMSSRIAKHAFRWAALAYLFISIVLMVGASLTLLQVNIEVVHILQYGLLAWLAFPLTCRYSDAMILATLGGIVDEAYQFYVLHANWGIYLDFNDIILNAVGAGVGVAALFIVQPRGGWSAVAGPVGSWRKLIPFGAMVLLGLFVCLWAAGVIMTMQLEEQDRWVILLRRCGLPVGFWHTTPWGKTYHQVLPLSGTVVTVATVMLYCLLDLFNARAETRMPSPGAASSRQ